MTASVPLPAWTMMTTVRGFDMEIAIFDRLRRDEPGVGVLGHEGVRPLGRAVEHTATVLPSRETRLRARLEPITASPTTPMFALRVFSSSSATVAPFGGSSPP